jgi:hypothetical protein
MAGGTWEGAREPLQVVTTGLGPVVDAAVHYRRRWRQGRMDCRIKSGNDELG